MAAQLCQSNVLHKLGALNEYQFIDGTNMKNAVPYFNIAVDFWEERSLVKLGEIYGTGQLPHPMKAQALKHYKRAHKGRLVVMSEEVTVHAQIGQGYDTGGVFVSKWLAIKSTCIRFVAIDWLDRLRLYGVENYWRKHKSLQSIMISFKIGER